MMGSKELSLVFTTIRLIGVIAFGIAAYWILEVQAAEGQKVGLMEILSWFPKFILGFPGASIILFLLFF